MRVFEDIFCKKKKTNASNKPLNTEFFSLKTKGGKYQSIRSDRNAYYTLDYYKIFKEFKY